jgi:hypothetical protein
MNGDSLRTGRRRTCLAIALAARTASMSLASGASASEDQATHRDFDPDDFSQSTVIDNQRLPLIPGTQLTLRGLADRGNGLVDHRVVLIVTDVTKVVNGVRALVVWDRDFSAGQIAEVELALQAQDDDGNVWNLGEYPEEFENGQFVGAPSTWHARDAANGAALALDARASEVSPDVWGNAPPATRPSSTRPVRAR